MDAMYLLEKTIDNKAKAIETVIVMKARDGKWRIVGYFIN